MSRLTALCLTVVLSALVTGCGPSAVTKVPQDVTLAISDVPAGFKLIVDKENTIQDIAGQFENASEMESKLRQNGFSASWRKDYERSGTSGATFIRSGASHYKEASGATFGVTNNASNQSQRTRGAVKLTSFERIGDESHVLEFPEVVNDKEVTTYAVYFRYLNVSNVILVSGPIGTHDAALAVDLAKKQLARAK